MLEKLSDRKLWIWIIFSLIFVAMGFRLAQLTIIEGEYYEQRALDTRLKKVTEIAKRGEIYDRNGVLLAGNQPSYDIQFLYNAQFTQDQKDMTVSLFNLLIEKGEKPIELPIVLTEEGFLYDSDLKKSQWLTDNGFDLDQTAEEVFQTYREREQIAFDLDKYSAQQILILKSIYLPIRVKDMEFTVDFNKSQFLKSYAIDEGTSAYEAFLALREYYRIEDTYAHEEAYHIITLMHAIRDKGYLKYEPITIAQNVTKETAILIQEQSMTYPNVSVEIRPVRVYPHDHLASHVLGYLGKVSTASEQEKYNAERGYISGDIIGKIGIEGNNELDLHGQNGVKWIEVNAYGRFVREIGDSIPDKQFTDLAPVAGKDIQLTIDIRLQEAVRTYLIKALDALQTGGTYTSEFGDTTFPEAKPNANTGAVVVVDVRTGEVLSMVSYPDYDLNLFAKGITQEDMDSLAPENARNPLAPRPLYNIATLTAVQPGSTFKMITGFAGLMQGLSPTAKFRDAGFIETLDGRTFACWLWNKRPGSTHGLVNLMEAIEVSCNYYFYNIANGYDYANDRKLNFEMNADLLIEYAKSFGLDEASGVEIGERVVGVPNPEQKKRQLLNGLRVKLNSIIEDYLPEVVLKEPKAKENAVNAIIDLGNNDPTISRNNLIRFMQNDERLQIESFDQASDLSDLVKYSYFLQMNWFEGDTFNLAIGQGNHAYTPVQMVRYIASIANGGYLYDLTLIKGIDKDVEVRNDKGEVVETQRLPLEPIDREPPQVIVGHDLLGPIQQGMYQVAHSARGSVYSYFKDFPMEVAAKTGTAEKEGKLPPQNEDEYILFYLKRIAPKVDQDELEIETAKVLKEKTDRLANLYQTISATEDPEIKAAAEADLKALTFSDYLNKGTAMREALKRLSPTELSNETIDQFKEDYDNFTWFVSYAPYDQPEIAVAVLIPQGGSGGYGASIVKDIYAEYFNLQAPAPLQ